MVSLWPSSSTVFIALLCFLKLVACIYASSYGGGGGGGGGSGGGMLIMKSGGKRGDMMISGGPCSPIPFMMKSGKGKKQQLMMIMGNGCKESYEKSSYEKPYESGKMQMVIPMMMLDMGGYGNGGYYMGGGSGGGSGYSMNGNGGGMGSYGMGGGDSYGGGGGGGGNGY